MAVFGQLVALKYFSATSSFLVNFILNTMIISSIDNWPSQIKSMINLLRGVVAGPKRKTEYRGMQLDLTYITDRIIAMAFPAEGFIESTYRNDIKDVANYFQQFHKDSYLIINVSSRPYNYAYFHDKVKDYRWPDHQAPALTTLIGIAFEMQQFLKKNQNNVVAVHCNHGKGRTGTTIISFMLFMGFYESAQQALSFYNKRRFNVSTYGVDQPCQMRYLKYIQELKQKSDHPRKLIAYRPWRITQKGLAGQNKTRSETPICTKLVFEEVQPKKIMLMGDVFIELFMDTWKGVKQVARINYNTYFLNRGNIVNSASLKVKFHGEDIKVEKKHRKDFTLCLEFQYFCLCHIQKAEQCPCENERLNEEQHWTEMLRKLESSAAQKNCLRYFYLEGEDVSKQGDPRKSEVKYEPNIISIQDAKEMEGDAVYLTESSEEEN